MTSKKLVPDAVDLDKPRDYDGEAVAFLLDAGMSAATMATFATAPRKEQERVVRNIGGDAAVAMFLALLAEGQRAIIAFVSVVKLTARQNPAPKGTP